VDLRDRDFGADDLGRGAAIAAVIAGDNSGCYVGDSSNWAGRDRCASGLGDGDGSGRSWLVLAGDCAGDNSRVLRNERSADTLEELESLFGLLFG